MHGRTRALLLIAAVVAVLATATAVSVANGRPADPGSSQPTPGGGNGNGNKSQTPAPNANQNADGHAVGQTGASQGSGNAGNENGNANANANGTTNSNAPDQPPAGANSQGDQHRSDVAAAVAADVTPASGTVTVLLPGTSHAVPLSAVQHLPAGTVIDASAGSVTLNGPDGKPGTFTGGAFVVRQTGGANARTVLQLTGGDFSGCPATRKARTGALRAAGRGRVIRRLWGRDHHGRFGTQGRSATASVRGTVWLTEDLCQGTRFSVREGAIVVRDGRRKVVVRAGKSYLVRNKH
jgi:hypothetical protein